RHNIPLFGARILRFINKNMVDAAIQLEEHPGCHGACGEKRAAFLDQIIIVEQRARALCLVKGFEDGNGNRHDRFRRLGNTNGSQARHEAYEPKLFDRQRIKDIRIFLTLLLGYEGLAWLILLGEESELVIIKKLSP